MHPYLFYVATSLLVFGRAVADIGENDVRQSVLDGLASGYIQLEDIRFSVTQFLVVRYKFDLTRGFLLLRMAEIRDAECRTVVTKRNYVYTTCYFDISRSVASYYVSPDEGLSGGLKGFNASATVRKGSVHVSMTLKPPGVTRYGDPLMVTVYVRGTTVVVSHPANIFDSLTIQKRFQRKARNHITRKIVEALEKARKDLERRLREILRKSKGKTSTEPPATTSNSTKPTSSSTLINNC
uniref:Secreted protein n=1 Tax=Rhipicephalus appendiculatus TaxID=34631 RepID=A0A131YFM7_RHIAP